MLDHVGAATFQTGCVDLPDNIDRVQMVVSFPEGGLTLRVRRWSGWLRGSPGSRCPV